MKPEQEQVFRGALAHITERIFGPQDEAELQGDWERFREEKLSAVLTQARQLPDDEVGQFLFDQMELWCLSQALEQAVTEPGSGLASMTEWGADGKLKTTFFRRKPKGK